MDVPRGEVSFSMKFYNLLLLCMCASCCVFAKEDKSAEDLMKELSDISAKNDQLRLEVEKTDKKITELKQDITANSLMGPDEEQGREIEKFAQKTQETSAKVEGTKKDLQKLGKEVNPKPEPAKKEPPKETQTKKAAEDSKDDKSEKSKPSEDKTEKNDGKTIDKKKPEDSKTEKKDSEKKEATKKDPEEKKSSDHKSEKKEDEKQEAEKISESAGKDLKDVKEKKPTPGSNK